MLIKHCLSFSTQVVKKKNRRATEKPGDDVADLEPQTSCCYETMNHLYTTADLRQYLSGNLTEDLF